MAAFADNLGAGKFPKQVNLLAGYTNSNVLNSPQNLVGAKANNGIKAMRDTSADSCPLEI